MSETKYVQYGDKKMPIGNLTLEQAKQTMARFFPELADPKIETKKSGDETVYVFTKQAGRKGAPTSAPWEVEERLDNARLIAAAPDLLEACELAEAAIKSLMDELAQQRATDWGVVNDALVKIGNARARVTGK